MGQKLLSSLISLAFILSLLFGLPVQTGAQEASGGVGLYLDFDPPGSGNLVVFNVLYRSPADKAKVKKGDQLLKVDGQEVQGKSLEDVAKMIRGPVGSTVTITFSRAGVPREVPLVRKAIKAKANVVLPPPSEAVASPFLTNKEKALVKAKILSLKTEAQKKRMMELLVALKNKQISKPKFMRAIKNEFP
ncbi:MAG: PDZ domain-containing protein [bacterium]|nr:PDZ domain-containing protein [bacterium]